MPKITHKVQHEIITIAEGVKLSDRAVAIARCKSNGQVVVYNFGSEQGRNRIWEVLRMATEPVRAEYGE